MDHLDKLRKEQETLKENQKIFIDLLDSPGWQALELFLVRQVQINRIRLVEDLINTQDVAFNHAGLQGEIAGIQRALKTATTLLMDIELELAAVNTQIEEAQEDE